MHDFTNDRERGMSGEAFLDEYFSQFCTVTPATPQQQRQGIDRIFISPDERLSVEYKTDARAQRTHNAFVETISVYERDIPGWAYSSHADRLAYYCPGLGLIYWIAFAELRRHLPRWQQCYPVRSIANAGNVGGWHTIGLLVPLREFEQISEEVINL